MAQITIEPAGPRDLAMHEAQYNDLIDLLTDQGFEAEISRWEYRSVAETAGTIVIIVGSWGATAKGLADLVRVIRRTLRDMRRAEPDTPRRVKIIWGPSGEVLREVELNDDEDTD